MLILSCPETGLHTHTHTHTEPGDLHYDQVGKENRPIGYIE